MVQIGCHGTVLFNDKLEIEIGRLTVVVVVACGEVFWGCFRRVVLVRRFVACFRDFQRRQVDNDGDSVGPVAVWLDLRMSGCNGRQLSHLHSIFDTILNTTI